MGISLCTCIVSASRPIINFGEFHFKVLMSILSFGQVTYHEVKQFMIVDPEFYLSLE